MAAHLSDTDPVVRVAIDIAKAKHVALVEFPDGRRQKLTVPNAKWAFERFARLLEETGLPCRTAFGPTADYHRPLAYFLSQRGFELVLVSSLAVARTRDVRYNSWDKDDPKDAQVILHLLTTGTTQRYYDPLVRGGNDLRELANTYQPFSLQKVRLLHSILTHYLPLYFPEAARYSHSSRAEWFAGVLQLAPCPAAVMRRSRDEFIREAAAVGRHKADKARWLADFYRAAETSVGLPVDEDSEAMRMFRLVIEQYRQLCRQFLKYCGFDLATQQSGQFRGAPKLSKRGIARLRYAFWMAGAVAGAPTREHLSRKV